MSKSFEVVALITTLRGIDLVYVHNNWYGFISFKMDAMSFLSTFSNRSFILFALKIRCRIKDKSSDSMRKSLTV